MLTRIHRATLLLSGGGITLKKHIIASLVTLIAIIATIALSTPVQAAGINNNPWGYDFTATHGSLITSPDPAFCGQYFHCIPNFPKGKGYVVECKDGMYSKSGGIHGSCSRHGGDGPILYAHESSTTNSSPSQPVRSQPISSGSSSMPSPVLPLTGSDPYATLVH